MKKYDVWVAAAAVLLQKRQELHYNSITQYVLSSGLTILANKGSTPSQTVGAILRKPVEGRPIFQKLGKGKYRLVNPDLVAQMPVVKEALTQMRNEVKIGKKLDAWAVAAAILIREEASLHYETIARRVRESDLTTLGEKGDTPAQTMGVILRKAYEGVDVFENAGNGYYSILNEEEARQLPQVEEALARLAAK